MRWQMNQLILRAPKSKLQIAADMASPTFELKKLLI